MNDFYPHPREFPGLYEVRPPQSPASPAQVWPEYPKINTIFKRDLGGTNCLILGEWSKPVFEYLRHCMWDFTEKIDGTNVRVVVDKDGQVGFRGRTDNAEMPTRLSESLRAMFVAPKWAHEALRKLFPHGGVMYGEGCGGKIQGMGSLYGDTETFVLFDVRVGPWWLRRSEVDAVARAMGLRTAPVVGRGSLLDLVALVRGGLPSRFGSGRAEGVVARPCVDLRERGGLRVIAKLKHRDFEQLRGAGMPTIPEWE